jgi:hypothetical protein
VRFQTNEAVAVQDPELVLRALETCLRDVSSEVARHGDQITLHGLGPSPRAVNYQDTTVLSVSAEDDKTIINADVSFQASSVLGDVPQDAVVREKLEQVFDQMRMQIDLERKLVAAGSSSSSPTDLPTSADASAVDLAAAASIAPAAVAAVETTEEPAEIPEDAVPFPAPREEKRHWDEGEHLVAMLRRDMQEDDPEPGDSNRRIWVIFAVIAFALLAAGFYLLRFRNHSVGSPSAASVSQPVASPSATSATQPPVASPSAASATQPPVTTPAATPPAADERTVTRIDAATIGRPPDSPALPAPKVDPRVWLEGWAAAMSSRDAVAQASFYADPVNQYIDRRNVSNAALVQAKRADIGRRQGSWTFSANDVVVENKTPSEATVRLVKHYMVEAGPSQVSEIAVNTRMQLKVVNGQWKIASEQELHAPAPAVVNPIDR